MGGMSISELARHGGVGVETIRYYQRRRLLVVPSRPSGFDPGTRMRRYDDADLRRLQFIRAAQAAGFTLGEIAELIELDATHDRSRVHALATQRIAALDGKIDELQRARHALAQLAGRCVATEPGPCPILDAFDPD